MRRPEEGNREEGRREGKEAHGQSMSEGCAPSQASVASDRSSLRLLLTGGPISELLRHNLVFPGRVLYVDGNGKQPFTLPHLFDALRDTALDSHCKAALWTEAFTVFLGENTFQATSTVDQATIKCQTNTGRWYNWLNDLDAPLPALVKKLRLRSPVHRAFPQLRTLNP